MLNKLRLDSRTLSEGLFAFFSPVFFFYALIFDFSKDPFEKLTLPLFRYYDLLLNAFGARIFLRRESLPFEVLKTQGMGSPFGSSFGDFPTTEILMHLETWLLSFFIKSPFVLLNVYYLLSFCLTSFCFWICFRKYFRHSWIRCFTGILFSFVPYHFTRYMHLFLANYYLVPVMIWFLLEVYSDRTRLDGKTILLLFLFASGGAYYFYFFYVLFVAIVTLKAVTAPQRRVRTLRMGTGVFFTGAFFFLLNVLPYQVYQWKRGNNLSFIERDKKAAFTLSIKFTNQLFPNPYHRIPLLKELGKKSIYFGAKNDREGYGENFGFLGLVGCLFALAYFLKRLRRPNPEDPLWASGFLLFFCLLFFSTGGIGCYFNQFVFSQFRSINRISIFMAALSFVGLGFFLEKLVMRFNKGNAWLLPLFLFGVYEITPLPQDPVVFENDSFYLKPKIELIKKMEKEYPASASLLHIPHLNFLNYSYCQGKATFLLGLPFIITQNLNFSYGVMRGRPEDLEIQNWLSRFDFDAIYRNYKGVWFDKTMSEAQDKEYFSKLKDYLAAKNIAIRENEMYLYAQW